MLTALIKKIFHMLNVWEKNNVLGHNDKKSYHIDLDI